MADLNDLLEEAEGQCRALSDELDTAVSSIDAMEGKARTLYERAAAGGSQVRSTLKALAQRLVAAEHALESARADAVSGLDALVEQAAAVRAGVGGLLEDVRAQVETLREQEERLDAEMDGRMQAVSADMGDVRAQIDGTQQAIAAQLRQAVEAIARFNLELQDAQTALGEKQSGFNQSLYELEGAASDKTREWEDALRSTLGRQATGIVDLANGMLERHNAAMEHLKTRFAADATQRLSDAIQPLAEVLEKLGERAGTHQGALSSTTETTLARVRAILPMLHELSRSFERSNRLG